jgi:hypothetical protein
VEEAVLAHAGANARVAHRCCRSCS